MKMALLLEAYILLSNRIFRERIVMVHVVLEHCVSNMIMGKHEETLREPFLNEKMKLREF